MILKVNSSFYGSPRRQNMLFAWNSNGFGGILVILKAPRDTSLGQGGLCYLGVYAIRALNSNSFASPGWSTLFGRSILFGI